MTRPPFLLHPLRESFLPGDDPFSDESDDDELSNNLTLFGVRKNNMGWVLRGNDPFPWGDAVCFGKFGSAEIALEVLDKSQVMPKDQQTNETTLKTLKHPNVVHMLHLAKFRFYRYGTLSRYSDYEATNK